MTKTNKKGQSAAILIVLSLFSLMLLVVVGFVFFAVKPVYDDITDDFIDDMELSNSSAQILLDTNMNYPVWLDNGFLWLLGGMWIAMLIMAYYSTDHPILILVLVIVYMVLIFSSAYVSNIWIEFSTSADYNDYRSEFQYTDFFLSHLPYVIGVMGFSIFIVYFMRQTLNSGGGI